MSIAVFTNSKPRHLALIRLLAESFGDVIAVTEASSARLGRIREGYGVGELLAGYFDRVQQSEARLFGERRPLPSGVRVLPMRMGELSHTRPEELAEVLACDIFVVFGSSWIRGWLADALIERRALNIHMGISPYYRGSACNFWALWDRRPDLVGATIHDLSRGLDDGDMLCHVVPDSDAADPFDFTMSAVRAAHLALVDVLQSGHLTKTRVRQDRTQQIRYSRSADFTGDVADEFMRRPWNTSAVCETLSGRDGSCFVDLRRVCVDSA